MEKNKSRRMMPPWQGMSGCMQNQCMHQQIMPEKMQHHINEQCMQECIPQEEVIQNVRLAAAYVPWQKMCSIFSPIEALKRGTVFPELFSPYNRGDNMRSEIESISRRDSHGK
ncbi:MAG: spore coat associated protein CotJA [Solirubrobacterales bacterium]